MKKRISMQDVADRLGITKVSVSKALAGRSDISEELREKILQTSKEMGYIQKSKTEKTYNFAFVVANRFFLDTDQFYVVIYYHLNKLIMESGNNLSLIVLSDDDEQNLSPLDSYGKEQIDGIFLSGQLKAEYVREIAGQSPVPLILLDFYLDNVKADFILADNFQLGYQAAQYLIERGHRSIGFVGDKFATSSIADRYFGYLKALTINRLPVRDDWVLINNNAANEYTFDIKMPAEIPTGFVCHCDMAAYFLGSTLENNGYKIPSDISLVSFDNTKLTFISIKRFTTFDVGRREIARRSFDLMLRRVTGDTEDMGRHYVRSHIIPGDSVREI